MKRNSMQKKSFNTFLIFWTGQLISGIGSGLTGFALGIYVFQKTHSATYYSLVLLTSFLPSLLLKPIGGTLSDRMDRRLLMIMGDLGSAVGVLFIVMMMYAGNDSLWVIYAGTFISSIFVAFQNPAYKASITDLVEKDFYTKASGLMQLAESSRYLVSPIIAGFLMKWVDIKLILMLDAASFLIAILCVFRIQKSASSDTTHEKKHFLHDLAEGFFYLFRNQAVFVLISVISVVTFFVGIFQALLGPMILSFSDAKTLGIIMTVSTTGMLIGGLFLGVFGKSQRKMPIVSASLVFSGTALILLGLTTNIYWITFFGFLFFLALPFLNTSLDVLVRQEVDNTMQGRVWGMISLISQLGLVMAFASAGYLADHVFNPWLLKPGGVLSEAAGALVGTGPGRGIAFMFVLSGMLIVITAIIISQLTVLKKLDAQ